MRDLICDVKHCVYDMNHTRNLRKMMSALSIASTPRLNLILDGNSCRNFFDFCFC